jgi:hypothetical protein
MIEKVVGLLWRKEKIIDWSHFDDKKTNLGVIEFHLKIDPIDVFLNIYIAWNNRSRLRDKKKIPFDFVFSGW